MAEKRASGVARKKGVKKSAKKSVKKGVKKSAAKKPLRPRMFSRESKAARKARTAEIIERLKHEYPDAHCSLTFTNPYELVVATILSAQCTDERVNQVTPVLFERYPDPDSLAGARQEDVEDIVRTTGFFRNKAKSLLGMANAVVERHGGVVPKSMDDLVQLPGVGRKTANVVLGNAFGINEGVVVDTHVGRVSQRLGLTKESDPVAIEQDLIPLVPRDDWTVFSHLLIYHGRAVCKAPTPRQDACVLCDICPTCVVRA